MKRQFFKFDILSSLVLTAATLVSVTSQATGLNGISSSLTVYSYPAHLPLNWSSPSGLLKSFADIAVIRELHLNSDVTFTSDYGDPGSMSSYYVSTMGHALNHANCTLPDGTQYDQWASYSGDNFASVDAKNALQDEIGMGVILYNYVDGYVIAGQENIDRLIYNKGTQGKPRYIQFAINSTQCQNLKNMIEFYQSFYYKPGTSLADLEARPPEKISYYNVQDAYDAYHARLANPEAQVGAGCAPFAGGLVKQIGMYDPLFETAWRRPVTISNKLIGQSDAAGDITYKVPLVDILTGPLSQNWTYSGFTNQFINMYDPTLIWSFVNDATNCVNNSSSCPSNVKTWMKKTKSVTVGTTETFSNTIQSSGSSPETTTVEIEGIVIRN